jgi:hypothetical protein
MPRTTTIRNNPIDYYVTAVVELRQNILPWNMVNRPGFGGGISL